jgi:hypothetical protein
MTAQTLGQVLAIGALALAKYFPWQRRKPVVNTQQITRNFIEPIIFNELNNPESSEMGPKRTPLSTKPKKWLFAPSNVNQNGFLRARTVRSGTFAAPKM